MIYISVFVTPDKRDLLARGITMSLKPLLFWPEGWAISTAVYVRCELIPTHISLGRVDGVSFLLQNPYTNRQRYCRVMWLEPEDHDHRYYTVSVHLGDETPVRVPVSRLEVDPFDRLMVKGKVCGTIDRGSITNILSKD